MGQIFLQGEEVCLTTSVNQDGEQFPGTLDRETGDEETSVKKESRAGRILIIYLQLTIFIRLRLTVTLKLTGTRTIWRLLISQVLVASMLGPYF